MKLKEKVFDLIKDDKVFIKIREVYIPFLGKTQAINEGNSSLEINVENPLYEAELQVLNKHRYDEKEEARYTIDYARAIFDFENMQVKGFYQKDWIGGLTERFDFNYSI